MVLIVAKCIVNEFIKGRNDLFILVLIVAKCIVNPNKAPVNQFPSLY